MPVVEHGTDSLPREIPLPAAGTWVKLRNLAATWVDGQLQVTPQYCIHDVNTLHHDRSGVCNHRVYSQGLMGKSSSSTQSMLHCSAHVSLNIVHCFRTCHLVCLSDICLAPTFIYCASLTYKKRSACWICCASVSFDEGVAML